MATATRRQSGAQPIRAAPLAVRWLGVPSVLSIALALDVVAATVTALLFTDAIRGPRVAVGCMQGTALVLLVVTVPVLALSMILTARGALLGLAGWFGALGSIAYQGVLFLFATPFNGFFFLYVAMLSLSIWSLVALAVRIPVEAVGGRLGAHAPVRLVAGYLLVNAALFLVFWLRATVPAVLSTAPPEFLAGSGMTTGPVQILDFAFTLPLMTFAAVELLQGRPWGRVITSALLVMLAIETASIAVDQWFGHAADPSSSFASSDMTPVFAVWTVLGIVMAALFFRPDRSEEPTNRPGAGI